MTPLLLCGLIAAATPNLPAAEDADVRAALARYDALEYDEVIPLLERALARGALAESDRRLALAYLGRAHAIHRQAAPAEQAFARLLKIDPGFTIPEYESPLIRAAFTRASERAAAASPEGAPDTTSTPPPSPDPAPDPAPDLASDLSMEPGPDAAPTPSASTAEAPISDEEQADTSSTTLWLAATGAAVAVMILGGASALLLLEPWAASDMPSGSLGRWELP